MQLFVYTLCDAALENILKPSTSQKVLPWSMKLLEATAHCGWSGSFTTSSGWQWQICIPALVVVFSLLNHHWTTYTTLMVDETTATRSNPQPFISIRELLHVWVDWVLPPDYSHRNFCISPGIALERMYLWSIQFYHCHTGVQSAKAETMSTEKP
jgi:hypothetical protein